MKMLVFKFIVLVFFLAVSEQSTANSKKLFSSKRDVSNLCLTPECIKAAVEILSNLDENVEPCDDFYRFACGGWIKRTTIPEDRSLVNVLLNTKDKLDLNLKVLMEKKLYGTEPSFIRLLKNMYDSCMDIESIEKAGDKPLRKILKDLGGWPVVEGKKWNKNKFDWIEVLISLRKFGYDHSILLSLSVEVDKRNNTFHIIELDQTALGMPDRSYLISGLNDTATAAYFKQMVKAATLLGANETTIERELLEALQFEMTLAKYSLPLEERRNVSKLYNKITVKDLQNTIPQIPWLRYLNGILNNEIFENETINIAVPEFVKRFAVLIASTDKRVIANYMLGRAVSQSLPLLSQNWKELYLEYNKVLTGQSQEEPRWQQCLSHLSESYLDIALGSYYVSQYFKEEDKDKASELAKYIHQEFLRILDEIDWMDKETKSYAKAKANNMIFYIGYPEELLNNTAVSEHYQNLTISNVNYFENIRRLQKLSWDKVFENLRKPNIRKESNPALVNTISQQCQRHIKQCISTCPNWLEILRQIWKEYSKAALVNAFYSSHGNIIGIPAGILQDPFFNKDRPNYLNFGSIGIVIGHEITHGFDDEGRQFDKNGNNMNWWAKTTDELFQKKAQCMIDQYSNYTAENGMELNGVITLGENIADTGGMKEAYWAYQTWVKENGQEKLLPGLRYNQNQLFWTSAANVWCSRIRPEVLKMQILSDTHSPEEFRIIGSMSNLAEFSRDFNCPLDSPMNRKQKCQVW